MNGLLGFANGLDTVARRVGKGAGWLILPLVLVIMFDVVTRKLDITRLFFADFTASSGFSVSTILQDMQWHLHGALLMLVIGFGYLSNAHVRVDIFREQLQRRGQAWLETIGIVLFGIPFVILMIKYSTDLTFLSWQQGEGSESLTGIQHRWIIKSAMPIGFAIVLMALLATLIRLLGYLFGDATNHSLSLDRLEIFTDSQEELAAAREAAERLLQEQQEQQRRGH